MFTKQAPHHHINHPDHLHSRLKDTCGLWAGIQILWFGVIRLSRIAPARRRKATVKTGRKPTITSTYILPDSTRSQSNITTATFILESNA